MDSLKNWLLDVLKWLVPPKPIGVIDVIQVLLLAFLVYRLILWMKNTRSYTLLKGIVFVIAFVVLANVFKMEVIVWLLQNVGVVAITAIIIIFQPELRRMLERVGQSNLMSSIFSINRNEDENKRFSDHTLNELVRACYEMSEERTGALIVLERDIPLEEYEKTGIPIDAVVSSQLLVNIFEHNTPLHDGAVLIRNDRVAAATCYLPLSDNMDLSKKLGTRHRAAVGISEVTDSLTIVVSEETGHVSYAESGRIRSAVTPSELREMLLDAQLYIRRRSGRQKGGRTV
ncbi:MAG: diadenylate cyclase CdaA [Eubacterium sp.]|nr:diadenylate cyclase CdaA [Eubacterium sp.]